jgi:5'-nucleotidase
VHRLARKSSVDASADCDAHTARIVHAERIKAAAHRRPERLWRLAASRALHATRAPAHYRDHIGVAEREHMHAVDGFEGGKGAQKGAGDAEHEGDLLTIHPEVDGRLEDVGRA